MARGHAAWKTNGSLPIAPSPDKLAWGHPIDRGYAFKEHVIWTWRMDRRAGDRRAGVTFVSCSVGGLDGSDAVGCLHRSIGCHAISLALLFSPTDGLGTLSKRAARARG